MKFLNQSLVHHEISSRRTHKQWIALLDELTALTVKARDKFHCRASGCGKQWLPVMLSGGRVLVAEDCHWAHIVPRARGLSLRHELGNGLTLCFRHHKKFDALDESEKIDFLESCWMEAETLRSLQTRAHEIKMDFDGAYHARIMIGALNNELRNCENLGLDMELMREQVISFFEKRI